MENKDKVNFVYCFIRMDKNIKYSSPPQKKKNFMIEVGTIFRIESHSNLYYYLMAYRESKCSKSMLKCHILNLKFIHERFENTENRFFVLSPRLI